MFAGIIVEGGVVGYDSNVITGGAGARYLGIGINSEYREDVITVAMRVVSVQTGEVLLAVSVTKTVLSVRTHSGLFRFIEAGTQAVEAELGNSQNEPVSHAVKLAVEQAVLEIVNQGVIENYWAFEKSAGGEDEEGKCKVVKQIECSGGDDCVAYAVECSN
jgi:curli production assembly/transport component CsgG